MRAFILMSLLITCSVTVTSQELSSQTRAQEIAAAFSKHKSVAVEKFGVKKQKYKDVRSEPAVKQNILDYAGVYEVSELGAVISIQVDGAGRIQASGHETIGGQSSTFRLENAKIVGALLTATKVYDNGTSEKFEGAFLTRTDRNSPTEVGTTLFGLGVLLITPREYNGLTYEKFFYQRK
jgi:hypothetical protein